MGLMDGVRVLEVSTWAFVPASAATLAEWGADVIKVEDPVQGDTQRGITAWGVGPETGGGIGPLFQIFNRGKRSIGIDLRTDEGREILMKLVDWADVFVTNFMPEARAKLGIDVDDIRQRNPRVIYARGTGQGPLGPDSLKGGFDLVSSWSRSGASRGAMPVGYDFPIPMPGPGFGDGQSGLNLAGGISAALFHRERTGESVVVDTSLFSSGLWAMQCAISGASASGQEELPHVDRENPANPVVNVYGTSDGEYLCLCMMQSDRYWTGLCEVLERPDLVDDPRFATFDDREKNAAECVAELDKVFVTRTLEDWKDRLARQQGQWEVIQKAANVVHDPQVQANQYIGMVEYPNGVQLPMVRVPMQFDLDPPELRPAPEHAAHTEEILLDLGYDWPAISTLKDHGAIN